MPETPLHINRLLIANRGEIACRVIRTARLMGIETVAVYSDADAGAMHVEAADNAFRLGPAPAAESYLRPDLVVAAAKATGADAVHPGYGFLSENADFADACRESGLEFVGPPAAAIRAMGSKSRAKTLMERAGVPVAPGYHGDDDSLEALANAAGEIGYPVLLKAVAGGGGKGMRVARDAAEIESQIKAARREAVAAFGDGRMLVEKFLDRPRHVEVQIFADCHGNVIHLFERDCSLQRRHQKILEEAPAPGMTEDLRAAMTGAAIRAAQAVDYEGAGTVEFMLDENGSFYFLEMNTRLQVEHPVTEMITGLDLVEWQLRVAAGEPLPAAQEDIPFRGHAIEVRLYAEDTASGFLPSTGTLGRMSVPEARGVRFDTGVRAGDEISAHYDPMIAKLAVWGKTRRTALAAMTEALAGVHISGLDTNRDFLAAALRHPAVQSGTIDTGLIDRDALSEMTRSVEEKRRTAVLAALTVRTRSRDKGGLKTSPWDRLEGWRLGEDAPVVFTITMNGEDYTVALLGERAGTAAIDDDVEIPYASVVTGDGHAAAVIDQTRVAAAVFWTSDRNVELFEAAVMTSVSLRVSGEADNNSAGAGAGDLTAPMPGRVLSLNCAVGDKIAAGAPLLILEAMKMEHAVKAPYAGVVSELLVQRGGQVLKGAPLLVIDPE